MQQDQPGQVGKTGQQYKDRKLITRYIVVQLILTVLLSVALVIYDFTVAYSALTGGLIATLANAWFALKIFRVKSKASPEVILAAFYVGEIYKFVLTGAMFVIAFVLIKPLSIVALLLMYLTIHLTPAIMSAFDRGNPVKKSQESPEKP